MILRVWIFGLGGMILSVSLIMGWVNDINN